MEKCCTWDNKYMWVMVHLSLPFIIVIDLNVQADLSCTSPPPTHTQDLGQAVSSANFYCNIILEYVVVRDINVVVQIGI